MAVRFSEGIELDAETAGKHGSSVIHGKQPTQYPTQKPGSAADRRDVMPINR
jgi:hypothetical protein